MATKVIFDTDIGSDIDDAVCLAYLLARRDCELVGITTVSGDVQLRASLASVLCQQAKANVPIIAGTERALVVEPRQPDVPQAAALRNWSHQTGFPSGVVDFMREVIRGNPHEVVLLAVGPLTNVAALFLTDPGTAHYLRAVVQMGAWFGPLSHEPEWNYWVDPHAASIVLGTKVAEHIIVPKDVTSTLVLGSDEVRRRFQTPLLAPVLDMAGVWMETYPWVMFNDPLAGLTVFDESVCRFERGHVVVQLDRPPQGVTRFVPDAASGPHRIATQVDSALFFDRYFGAFSDAESSRVSTTAPASEAAE